MTGDTYVVRVVYKNAQIELHEYNNKKKAMAARDRFRAMDTVETAKMMLAGDKKRLP